jgi:hypothetical protein
MSDPEPESSPSDSYQLYQSPNVPSTVVEEEKTDQTGQNRLESELENQI